MKWLAAFILIISSLGTWYPTYAKDNCEAETGILLSGKTGAPWVIQIQPNPIEIPLNAPFNMRVTICSQSHVVPTRLSVDATMPEHKHGMNYEPKAARIDNHQYMVKNLLFHMPGVWRLEITAYENDSPHRFTHDINLQ